MIPALLALALAGPASATEVTVWHAYRGPEKAAFDEVASAWSSSTGHTVSAVALPFGAFASKLETAIPRGNGPDLFLAAHDNLGKWTAMDLVLPATGPTDGYRPVTVDAMTWQGTRYGEPLAFKSLLLLYDPGRIDSPPQTTDELVTAARAETGDGRYGLAYQAAEPYFHAPWMHAFGGEALGPDGAVLDSDAQIAALALTKRLSVDEGIAPTQPTGELVSRLYREGRVSFVISGPWFVADMDRPVAAAPLPRVSETGEAAQPYLTVDGAFVAAHSEHPELAAQLAKALAGPDGSAVRVETGGQAVAWADTPLTDPLLQVLARQAAFAVPMPADPNLSNAFEAQARALRATLRGTTTPDVAARGAQTYYDVLSRPPPPPVSPTPWLVGLAVGLLALVGLLVRRLSSPVLRQRLRQHRADFLWIAPAALSLAVLVVLPFLTGAAVSLFAHSGGDWTFVGFQHFLDIVLARDWPITSPLSFVYTLVVTITWTVTNLLLHVGIGVAMALLLREPWIRLRGVWRALLILPWAVPNYITALIWKSMFHTQFGAINALLGIGLGRDGPAEIDWFGSWATAFTANVVTNTWLGFPFMMVITLGALQAIPRDLEEAAEVDGASWWFRFRHVVWPLLRPALVPAILLGSVWTFNMFNVVYLVSAGEPDGGTEILISEAYRWAFSRGNRYGYAAAYAVLIFGVLLVYSRFANRMAGRKIL